MDITSIIIFAVVHMFYNFSQSIFMINCLNKILKKNHLEWSRSSSRWDFYFHSYVLTIYVRLYWILELVVFDSLVRRGYIHKVSVQLVQIFFHAFAVLKVFHAANEKIGRKQDENNAQRKENQNVVANPPGSSSLYYWSAIALLSHRYR